MQLTSGNNPRLTLECYFAVTSNTVQFGAKLELYAKAMRFNVYGFLSFDVLFQFSPFYFIASVSAMLAFRCDSRVLGSVGLDLTLEGPGRGTPPGRPSSRSAGSSQSRSASIRPGRFAEPQLEDVAVLPLLIEALSAPGTGRRSFPTIATSWSL